MSYSHHVEPHLIHRTGWLRAAVLGANDGIISVTSLIMGMAASGASSQTLLITCIAGLISGASSMAAGEYISVKSQSDIEEADLKLEARELDKNPHLELKELTQIYIQRGLNPELAHEVAVQLSAWYRAFGSEHGRFGDLSFQRQGDLAGERSQRRRLGRLSRRRTADQRTRWPDA